MGYLQLQHWSLLFRIIPCLPSLSIHMLFLTRNQHDIQDYKKKVDTHLFICTVFEINDVKKFFNMNVVYNLYNAIDVLRVFCFFLVFLFKVQPLVSLDHNVPYFVFGKIFGVTITRAVIQITAQSIWQLIWHFHFHLHWLWIPFFLYQVTITMKWFLFISIIINHKSNNQEHPQKMNSWVKRVTAEALLIIICQYKHMQKFTVIWTKRHAIYLLWTHLLDLNKTFTFLNVHW